MTTSSRPSSLATLPDRRVRGALLEVDLDAVAHNTRHLARHTGGELMAVVKADGFGHGAVAVARTALANGATSLGVTSLAEALALRAAGISAPVLSWLNEVDADHALALRQGVELAVPGREHLEALVHAAALTGTTARVHLHLDVGMARDGCSPSLWPLLCARARVAELRGLVQVVGVMGHLGCADHVGDACNEAGLAAFQRGVAVARATGLRPSRRHLAATSAALQDPRTHLDGCRVGAGLVGIDPSRTTAVLRPAMTLTAPVVQLREVVPGTHVGYGHAHTATARTRLALLPVGYADGLPRAASGRAEVLVGGRRRPVVGRISMDQVVVDVGGADTVRLGDRVTVFGPGSEGEPTVREWADWTGTLEHEIVTGIGARVERSVR